MARRRGNESTFVPPPPSVQYGLSQPASCADESCKSSIDVRIPDHVESLCGDKTPLMHCPRFRYDVAPLNRIGKMKQKTSPAKDADRTWLLPPLELLYLYQPSSGVKMVTLANHARGSKTNCIFELCNVVGAKKTRISIVECILYQCWNIESQRKTDDCIIQLSTHLPPSKNPDHWTSPRPHQRLCPQ